MNENRPDRAPFHRSRWRKMEAPGRPEGERMRSYFGWIHSSCWLNMRNYHDAKVSSRREKFLAGRKELPWTEIGNRLRGGTQRLGTQWVWGIYESKGCIKFTDVWNAGDHSSCRAKLGVASYRDSVWSHMARWDHQSECKQSREASFEDRGTSKNLRSEGRNRSWRLGWGNQLGPENVRPYKPTQGCVGEGV